MEIWRDVVGFEGIYEVSNIGNIRTIEGKTTSNSKYKVRHWKQRSLKLKHDRNGYKRVCLWKDGKNNDWLVHRVVATAFISNPNNYPMINHIDGVSNHNDVDNLEWCDSNHNVNHAFDTGLMNATKTKLIRVDNGQEYVFRSKSYACKFMGRSHTYINDKLRKEFNKVIDINGIEYKIEFM